MKVICVTFRKGGSGKTATVVNLAAGLVCNHGKKVLVIDADPQASATLLSGFDNQKIDKSLFLLLYKSSEHFTEDMVRASKIGYDIVCSNKTESIQNLSLNYKHIPVLRDKLAEVQDVYDYVIIDTPPGESIMTQAAIFASDYVLMSIEATVESYDSIQKTIDEVHEIRRRYNEKLKILGIFFNLYDARLIISQYFYERVQQEFGKYLIPLQIKHTTKYKDAAYFGQSIFQYDPKYSEKESGYKQLTEYVYQNTLE